MSALMEITKREENDNSMTELSNQTFSLGGSVLEPRENMTTNSDQADLLTHVRFIESICSEGPAKAAYVNGSSSPNISDEILLDISKNVPGFLPKSLHAQNSTVTASVQFEECDPLRKDGEMTIRQMLTAEDVENRGIWGFDEESPEDSMDCYDDSEDIGWNPQKEFMKFLMEDNDRSETEEKIPSIPSTTNQRRRKRKMDIVVKVDPSEELSTDLALGEGSQVHHNPVSKGDLQRKRPRSFSSVSKNTKYSNGTTEALKRFIPKQAKNTKYPTPGFVRKDPNSEDEPEVFRSNNKFKVKSHSVRPTKNHSYTPDRKPFVCKECGKSFSDHNSLLKHITIHKKKRQKVKGADGPKDEGKDARLQCPQCTFGTNCPNSFVQHAKTHEKDKRYYRCQKCHFVAMNESELRGHMLCKHRVSDFQVTMMGKQDGMQEQKVRASESNATTPYPVSFSCKLCSFKTKNKNILRNHFEMLHPHAFNENLIEGLHFMRILENSDHPTSLCKLPTVSSQSPGRKPKQVLSEETRKKESPKSKEVPSIIKAEKAKRNDKSVKNQSKLLKSLNTLLSQKRRKASENDTNQKTDKKRVKILDVEKCNEDSLDPESIVSGKERLKSPSKCKGNLLALKERSSASALKTDVSNNDDGSQVEKSGSKYKHLTLVKPSLKKSPSKRKMSTPFHNMQGQDILINFPKCRQTLKNMDVTVKCHEKDNVNNEDGLMYDSSVHPTKKCDVKDGLYANSQLLRRRLSLKKGSPGSKSKQDMGQTFSIKEECTETEVFCNTSQSSLASEDELSTGCGTDLKSCPYCPAEFESGISLSNHIRGHMHRKRVGLDYVEHHNESPNKVPQVKRRTTAASQVKREEDLQQMAKSSKEKFTCPMCREWFDNRKGLTNHVRGHLKRLGKVSAAANRSPVNTLKEMMRDKKQFLLKLQALEKKCRATNKLYPFVVNNGLIYSTAKVQRFGQSVKRSGQNSSQSREEKKRTEVKDAMKGSPSSDLIGILKKRRAHEEAKAKSTFYTARKSLLVSPVKECGPALQQCKALHNAISDKNDHNRKVCAHCNTAFHSGISLSNHLRAYARRKRNALMEGTTYDCKTRKQRSRPWSKKKAYPLLHAPEEIYRLTCRFCDLVFQGPLSVQEDWVKHLQRHIMNTAVPHTGAGMVEVTCFPKEESSDTETQAKPCS
ncbi:zinc finger protein 644a [Hoplias malabaricus]|uniref:zinc finger protein 644a n=1 Tax=Hoplias malabaricus TaxID=27720 RepID=UPI0034629BDF